MAEQVQRRRDNAADIAAATPVVGEVWVDTTNKRQTVGDGVRTAGYPQASFEDVQDQTFVHAGVAGGTANALTLSIADATLDYNPSSYRVGQRFSFEAAANNTGAVTVNVNSLGTRSIKKFSEGSKTALEADDLVAGAIYGIVYDGTDFQLDLGGGGGGDVALVAQAEVTSGTVIDITGLTSDYAVYEIEVTRLRVSQSPPTLFLRFSDDNGSSFYTSNYWWEGIGSADTRIRVSELDALAGSTADVGVFTFKLFDPTNTGRTTVLFQGVYDNADTAPKLHYVDGYGRHDANAAINALRLYINVGSFVDAVVKVYGKRAQ